MPPLEVIGPHCIWPRGDGPIILQIDPRITSPQVRRQLWLEGLNWTPADVLMAVGYIPLVEFEVRQNFLASGDLMPKSG